MASIQGCTSARDVPFPQACGLSVVLPDDLGLMEVDPAGEGGEEESQSEDVWHVMPVIDAFGVASQASCSRPDPSWAEYSDRRVIRSLPLAR